MLKLSTKLRMLQTIKSSRMVRTYPMHSRSLYPVNFILTSYLEPRIAESETRIDKLENHHISRVESLKNQEEKIQSVCKSSNENLLGLKNHEERIQSVCKSSNDNYFQLERLEEKIRVAKIKDNRNFFALCMGIIIAYVYIVVITWIQSKDRKNQERINNSVKSDMEKAFKNQIHPSDVELVLKLLSQNKHNGKNIVVSNQSGSSEELISIKSCGKSNI